MSACRAAATLLALASTLALAACGPGGKVDIKLPVKLPFGAPAFDHDQLESAIDNSFGGVGVCVVIDDTASGRQVYRYNAPSTCMLRLPPCETFEIANDLIGLDAGLATPQTRFKWDGTPQPVKAWEHDADMKTAFRQSMTWWQQRVAEMAGAPLYQRELKDLDYGNRSPAGPLSGFWLGPSAGGGLAISTNEQASFLHRLYSGSLPVKPQSLAYVEQLMLDETRGGSIMSGKAGSCPSAQDSSRQVSWWVGRLKTPKHDYVFAASTETPNDSSLPGVEIERRVKSAFADAGLWPSA